MANDKRKARYQHLRDLGFTSKQAGSPLKWAKKEAHLRDALFTDLVKQNIDLPAKQLLSLFRKTTGLSIGDQRGYGLVRLAKEKPKDVSKVRKNKRRSNVRVVVNFRDATQSLGRSFIKDIMTQTAGRSTKEIERSAEGFAQTDFGVVPRSEWTFDIINDSDEEREVIQLRRQEGMMLVGSVDPHNWRQIINTAELIGLLVYGTSEKFIAWMEYMTALTSAGAPPAYIKKLGDLL